MSVVVTKTSYTPEELLAMPDEKDYELVDGRRVSGMVTWLRAEDELSGKEVLPGFRCPVAVIFPPWAEDMPVPQRP